MTKEKKEFYVDPEEFMDEIVEWINMRKEDPNLQWTDALCKKFILIVDGLSHHPSFSGYSYVDEMKDEAILNIMKYGHNYDPEKINPQTKKPYPPFSYYNRIAWQAFVAILNKEKRQQDTKAEYFLKNFTLDDNMFIDGAEDHGHALQMMAKMYDNK